MPVKRMRVNTSDHDSCGWPSTWNRLYLKGRRAFKNTVLNQLSLSSTITQSTASENHVKLSSLKLRYNARKKKTQRHGRERQNVFLVYARILGPCVTIFMGRVLMNRLHRNWRTLAYQWGVSRTNGKISSAPLTGTNPTGRGLSSPTGGVRVVHCETLSKIKSV